MAEVKSTTYCVDKHRITKTKKDAKLGLQIQNANDRIQFAAEIADVLFERQHRTSLKIEKKMLTKEKPRCNIYELRLTDVTPERSPVRNLPNQIRDNQIEMQP